jgi:hypothetical protein
LELSIVKRIIHRLDGDVGYEEADGDGGVFLVYPTGIKKII